MDNIIKVNNLTKTYDNFKLDNITLEIKKGSIIGLIGENGAGKTTLIKLLLGLIKKDKGDILIFNKTLSNKVKEDIGVVLDDSFFPEVIKVKDVNSVMKNIYNTWDEKLFFKYLKDFSLNENMLIKNLSKGMKKKLEIITALSHHPKLLILDEPTSGLDPIMQQVFYQLLLGEKKKGTTILYSTHILSEVSKICDRIGMIKEGRIIKEERIENMEKNSLTYLTIDSEEIEKIKKTLNLKVIMEQGTTIKFVNHLKPNEMMNLLSPFKINKLLVEEVTIEDLFLEYYK